MNFFGFMDETGVLKNGSQPYFALGLLRLYDTSVLLQQITATKAKHRGLFIFKNLNTDFEIAELKFNALKTKKYLAMYKEIVKACLNYKHFYFSVILIERNKVNSANKSTWNLQLSFAKRHIKENCKEEDNIAILADYLNKPKNEPSFEDKMRKLPQVFNACMLESNTSIFIQVVDIFIGAVIYRYKHLNSDNKKTSTNS